MAYEINKKDKTLIGFIEVTQSGIKKERLININKIEFVGVFGGLTRVVLSDNTWFDVEETYDEVIELIKKAQER